MKRARKWFKNNDCSAAYLVRVENLFFSLRFAGLCFVFVFFLFVHMANIHTFLFILAMQLTCKQFLAKRLIMCKWSFQCVSPHHLLWMMVTFISEMFFSLHVSVCVSVNEMGNSNWNDKQPPQHWPLFLLQSHGNRTNRIHKRNSRLHCQFIHGIHRQKFIHDINDLSYHMFVCSFGSLAFALHTTYALSLPPFWCWSFFAN